MNFIKKACYLISTTLLFNSYVFTQTINHFNYSIIKSETYSKASVSCAHPLAAMYGAKIMQEGGNAFDAAIITQLVLAVVYPAAGNIGGGGFIVAKTKRKLIALDYRETAPNNSFEKMYLDKEGNPQTNLSQKSALASV